MARTVSISRRSKSADATQSSTSSSTWGRRLAHLDELLLDWVASADFDGLLVETVRSTYPPHEHEQFVAHFRGLVGLWVRDEKGATQPV